jgi:predicted thioredoxin/glutaredoxin
VRVVLVTRAGCHLCDEALGLLRERGVEPELADVDADDRLFDFYDWRVPVLLLDGEPVAEGKITREQLEEAFGRSGRVSGPG